MDSLSKINEKYPILTKNGKIHCECSDGWFDIIDHLCNDLEKHIIEKKYEDFKIWQVKEKFGGLRFYVSFQDDEINEMISEAEKKSYETCEECGEDGKMRSGGWIRTLCDKHDKYNKHK
jgi:hypothetical protein